jgi:hypothetical protein
MSALCKIFKESDVLFKAHEILSEAFYVFNEAAEIFCKATYVINEATEILIKAICVLSEAHEIFSKAFYDIDEAQNRTKSAHSFRIYAIRTKTVFKPNIVKEMVNL